MIPKVLTIAGSDSGGGAGIQADIKTFQELDVYGMSAITALTAQNTLGVQSVYPIPLDMILEQLQSIQDDLPPDAVKTGMLFSNIIIDAVSKKIKDYGWGNLVVDPVMIAKGGARLLQEEAIRAIREKLLPLATITTPNIPEAEVLTEMNLDTLERRKEAAKLLCKLGSDHVVIKGGHGNGETLIDLFYDGIAFTELTSSRIDTRHTHGTGCTFAAAIASGLAKGQQVDTAVKNAKAFIQCAIEMELGIGSGHGPTNHWAYKRASVRA